MCLIPDTEGSESLGGICYIVGAGNNDDTAFRPEKGDYVIAADAGLAHLEKISVKADLVVGDFDSLGKAPDHPNVISSPAEKDERISSLPSVRALIEDTGHSLYSVHGRKVRPHFSCVQTLSYLTEHGAAGYMLGMGMVITAVKNGKLKPAKENRGIVSVFSNATASRGVDLTGLKYRLVDATVTSFMPIGVSNEFTGSDCAVSVREGTLIVMWYQSVKEALKDITEGKTVNLSGLYEESDKDPN
jgi:thiamine pyrophosphokinase